MCGIFGLITKPGKPYSNKAIRQTLENIAVFSESRGKDSSGMAIRNLNEGTIDVIKGDVPIRQLLKSKDYDVSVKAALKADAINQGFSAFGHARLVTNGTQLNEANNQPVLKEDIIIIHNGIIVNVDELWQQNPDLERKYSIDTEIIPALIRKQLKFTNDLAEACNKAFEQLEGTWSVAIMFQDLDQFVLATNNGSLYYITDNENFITFASEGYFLERLKKTSEYAAFGSSQGVKQLIANQGLVVDMCTQKVDYFDYPQSRNTLPALFVKPLGLKKHLLDNLFNKREVVIDPSMFINRSKEVHLFNLLENNVQAISKLLRCSKCLLPETFPFIQYDHEGVCNYCKNYVLKDRSKNRQNFINNLESFKSVKGSANCIVPFSGGRDSTYSIHFITKELGLKPLAYTYDWGMVTDLARRNIARVCGKLGIEHVIVAADIWKKRSYIRKNINAWTKNPQLGMIPLFMSGDKAFHYHLIKLQEHTGISLNIWGENYLEKTDFKTGFAGVSPEFNKNVLYSLSVANYLQLFSFLAKSVINNPSYINASILDNLVSQYSRSFQKKVDYYNFFDFYDWNEDEVIKTIAKYEWEYAIDTKSSWRIGDGTSAFYNYIYYTVAGFSEFDTFRSNQIREGQIDRETGLRLIENENEPRYETLRWYLEILNLDFQSVIKAVNLIPKLYQI
jgi:glucosamine--fructose-6-phosphate aminotransferase (isomerizing)